MCMTGQSNATECEDCLWYSIEIYALEFLMFIVVTLC